MNIQTTPNQFNLLHLDIVSHFFKDYHVTLLYSNTELI